MLIVKRSSNLVPNFTNLQISAFKAKSLSSKLNKSTMRSLMICCELKTCLKRIELKIKTISLHRRRMFSTYQESSYSQRPKIYFYLEEIYDRIDKEHIGFGHGGRDRTYTACKKWYENVSYEFMIHFIEMKRKPLILKRLKRQNFMKPKRTRTRKNTTIYSANRTCYGNINVAFVFFCNSVI